MIHQDIKTAAKNVNYWTGVTTIMPLIGGFLADAYTGRFNMVLFSSLIYLMVNIYTPDSKSQLDVMIISRQHWTNTFRKMCSSGSKSLDNVTVHPKFKALQHEDVSTA